MSTPPTTPPPMYVFLIMFYCLINVLIFIYSESTPPTTPQRNREAGRWQERDARIMGSPENRRIPQHYSHPHPLPV